MSDVVEHVDDHATLPGLVDRAAKTLAGAHTAAEVLFAQEMASAAYDAAKRSARLTRAKNAHDELLSKIHRAQADALEVEAGAKRRLADEYDAAQERGEVQKHGGQGKRDVPNENIPSVSDIGLTRKDIHEARLIRDAEKAEPGIVKAAIDEALASGEEPTRAKVRRAVLKTAASRKRRKTKSRPTVQESPHDRDLRMLLGVWEAACPSARSAFLEAVTNEA